MKSPEGLPTSLLIEAEQATLIATTAEPPGASYLNEPRIRTLIPQTDTNIGSIAEGYSSSTTINNYLNAIQKDILLLIAQGIKPPHVPHTMATQLPTHRRAGRRTDDFTPGTPKVQIVTEEISYPLSPLSVLIAVRAVSLNYRDANIAHGGNPWPVIPHGILCNDAAGEVIAIGSDVTAFKVGDRAAPVCDTENVTGRETKRSWLAADEDGVLADHVVFEERKLTKLPEYLPWEEACIVPCAGVTAWSALKGLRIGQTVLIQGTS